MTDKQTAFVREYLTCLNATEAAKKAGYSEHTAYSIGQENLKKPEIKQAIDTAMNERAQRTELTQDYVLHNLQEIAERCMQKRPVMVKGVQATDDEGRHLWTFDAKNAIRSIELLGKHLGMFTDKMKAEISTQELDVTAQIRRVLLQKEADRDISPQEESIS